LILLGRQRGAYSVLPESALEAESGAEKAHLIIMNESKQQPEGRENESRRELRQMEDLAEKLSIPVRYESGEMRGGLCRVGSNWQVILNRDLPLEEKVDLLAESLAQFDLDEVYVPPRLRRLLDEIRNQHA
jgi:hypothetical protein